MRNRLSLQWIFIIIPLMFVSCAKQNIEVESIDIVEQSEIVQQKSINEKLDADKETKYNIEFSKPKIIGTSRAIFYGEINTLEEVQIKDIKLLLVSEKELQPKYTYIEDNKIYAVFDGLISDSDYSLKIQFTYGCEKITLDNQQVFSTPSQSNNNLDIKINEILSKQVITQENKLLIETQACMNMLGLETDEIGTYGFLTQANIVRLEYSLNSYDSFIDYSHIYCEPTQELLDILKSIICASGDDTCEKIIRKFKVSHHPMTDYAKQVSFEDDISDFCGDCTDFCGEIDTDKYIYDLSKNDEQAYKTYIDFPYIKESQEFKDKYKYKDFSELRLELEAAQNKAMFSMHESKWLKTIAVPKERIVPIAGADDDSVSLSTMIALSYMAVDAYYETGKILLVRSGIRTYNVQEKIHYRAPQRSDINYWKNLTWYRNRQKVSEVAGFSNHQYGYAIDFEGKFNYGISSFTKYSPELYKFLLKYGTDYGFYRNALEPWHWAYLGKTFDSTSE